MVSVGNFRLTADDNEYPIPADNSASKTLYLVGKHTPAQVVNVEVTDLGGKTVSKKDYTVSMGGTAVDMPKGTNLATVRASAGGPSDKRIGFYLG